MNPGIADIPVGFRNSSPKPNRPKTEMDALMIQPYTAPELEQMIADLESDLAERKESFRGGAPESVREAVCAFANDLPNHRRPGVVCVGVNDKGSPTGLAVTDELLRSLADIKTDGNITPPPTLTVGKEQLSGRDVAVITVWPADSPPVRYKGRIFIRIGPRRGLASAQDERILNEKRRFQDRPFDVHPISHAQLQDLDLRRFQQEYLPSLLAPDVLVANERSDEERLAAAKMVASNAYPTPTVLGLLVLGKDTRAFLPGGYIQFLRVAGEELGDPIIDEQTITGTVADQIRQIDEKLTAHNRTRVDIVGGSVEQRHSDYPLAALQQLTRNAILHRTYEGTNAPVRVYWFSDRIEIMNPGGPYGEVTAENFGQPGITDYRNPNLAEAMRALGFVQRFGVGIALARRLLRENGNPELEFQPTSGHLLALVRKSA